MNEETSPPKVEKSSSIKTFISPVLTQISTTTTSPKLLPSEPFPQCTNCPNAMWFLMDKMMLRCWCKVMNMVSWDSQNRNPLPLCDGIYQTDEE